MTRTYILGAGASLGYNDDVPDDLIPPGTNDFFAKGAKSGLLFDDDFQELSEAVIEYKGIDDDLENIDFEDLDIDVEEFLQYLHESMDSVSSEFTSMEKYERYQGALSSVYFFIYEILRGYKLGLSPENNNYVKLARDYLNQPYNVISLNYDLLFEYAIEYANLDYHYQSHHWEWDPNIPIAKIHGSINWINEFEDMFVGDRPFSEKIQAVHTFTSDKSEHILTNKEIETNSYRDLVFNLKKPQSIPSYSEFIHTNYINFSPNVATFLYEPSIIPPVGMDKNYDKIKTYARQQRFAEAMLKQTSELVIIGCSMRKQDEVLNKLLENNLEDEIDVILAVGSQIDGVKNRLNDLSVDFNFVDEIRYFTDFSEKYL